jgi:hypothetical protein
MQNKATISKILILIMSSFAVISLWFFSDFLFSTPNRKNLEFIPQNALIKVRINGKSLIGKSIENILINNNDNKLLIQIDSLIQQTLRSDVENTGIDFFSEIGAYVIENDDKLSIFITINLEDRELFSQFASKSNLKKYLIIGSSNVAIIQFDLEQNDKNLITQTLKTNEYYKFSESDFKNDMTIVGVNLNNKPMFKINGNVYKDKIEIIGKLNRKLGLAKHNYSLIRSGFHFTVNETLACKNISHLLNKLTNYDNSINKIEFNYRGIALTEGGTPYFAEPDFDLLLSYQNQVNKDSVLNFLNKYNELGIKYLDKKLSMGNSDFLIKTLENNQLYISRNTKNLTNKQNHKSFEVLGSPELLTKIKAPDYITSFFDMMTPFASAKSYLSSIENIDFSINDHTIKTEVNFKKDKNTFQETIKAFIILKGIQ